MTWLGTRCTLSSCASRMVVAEMMFCDNLFNLGHLVRRLKVPPCWQGDAWRAPSCSDGLFGS